MKNKFHILSIVLSASILMNCSAKAFAIDEQNLKSFPFNKQEDKLESKTILKGNIKEEFRQARPLTGIGVIGLRFVHQTGYPSFVDEVYSNSPASKAGIRPQDLIFAIDGIRTDKLTSDGVYQLLAGTPGSKVRVFLTRGQTMFNVEMFREDLANFAPEVQNRYLAGPIVVPVREDFFLYH